MNDQALANGTTPLPVLYSWYISGKRAGARSGRRATHITQHLIAIKWSVIEGPFDAIHFFHSDP
jgi:hypothetical protein